jgi:RND family efflux transporter MFP subunit
MHNFMSYFVDFDFRINRFKEGFCLARLNIIILCLLVTVGCKPRNSYVPPPPTQVVIAHPIKGIVTPVLEFTGNIQAIKSVQLLARVEGVLLQAFLKEGEKVKEGELLFQIQHDTYDAKLQQAQAKVIADKATLVYAGKELVRYTELLKQKAAPQTQVDNWQYQLDSARAKLISSEADVALAKLNVSYTRVTAPFEGVIGRRLKDPGSLVGGGEATVLSEVSQTDHVYANFSISEHDLLDFKEKYLTNKEHSHRVPKFPVYLGLSNEEGYPHQGFLDYAGISLDNGTGSLALRAIFANSDHNLIPGLFVRIKLMPSDSNSVPVSAILIPDDVVELDQEGNYVLIVDENNIVQRRSVKTGIHQGKMVAIQDGLSVSDWVVVNGVFGALPGNKINPTRDIINVDKSQLSSISNTPNPIP